MSDNKSSGLGRRVLTSLVAVPILIALIGWTPWYGFGALVWAAITLSCWELFSMLLHDETSAMRSFAVGLGSLVVGALIFVSGPLQGVALPNEILASIKHSSLPLFHLNLAAPIFFIALLVVAATALFARGASEDLSPIPRHFSGVFFGIVYLGLCGALIAHLGLLPDGLEQTRHGWVFLAVFGTFAADTMAYFFGKTIGGPKMAPSVSPNKTWAGLLGCVVGGMGWSFAAQASFVPLLRWYDCILLGLLFALIGQMGDLFMSLLKRSFKIKDTGSILPGHGGMLDRIDALLFTGPLIFHYALWVVLPRVH